MKSMLTTPKGVCLAVLEYLDSLFLKGADGGTVNHLIAGLKKFCPVIKNETVLLGRIEDAAAGWKKRAPGFSRPAPPASAVHAVVGSLIADKKILKAVAVELSFSGYLRPMDLNSLKVEDLVPPQPWAGANHDAWALLLHSVDSQSKTAERDESIVLDGEVGLKLNSVWKRMVANRGPLDKLFPFTQAEFCADVVATTEKLGMKHAVGFVAYSLRHAGASHDLLSRQRPMSEIKLRGRWKCDSSVQRYAKASHAQMSASLIDSAVLEYMTGQKVVPVVPKVQLWA